MKNNKFAFIIILIVQSIGSFGQKSNESISYTKYVCSNSDTFLISTRPVTNREYIIYLLWLKNTRVDYPEVLINAIPGIKSTFDFYTAVTKDNPKNPDYVLGDDIFKQILKYTPSFVKDYIFNPVYIDFPVVGVSWLQANQYCKWLSDRYNEYKLIKYGYFLPDSDQNGENCFVTEAYLADQYYGNRRKGKEDTLIKWNNRMLTPIFRLPSSKECYIAKKLGILEDDFIEYKFSENSFLDQWYNWYMESSNEKLILKNDVFDGRTHIDKILLSENKFAFKNYHFKELYLDNNYRNESLCIEEIYNKKRPEYN